MALVYLDHPASTPLDPRVLEAMRPCFRETCANPASAHGAGRAARALVEQARAQVAAPLGADPQEVVLTSGATEALNLALRGCGAGRLITCATEHRAVLDPAARLAAAGVEVVVLPPRPDGRLEPALLAEALAAAGAGPTLVAIMAVNNETGVLHPLAEVGRLCRAHGARFLCDAVQAYGKLPLDVEALGVDLLALSAHKLNGPKGAGALYVRRGLALEPLLYGGGQEGGLRPGTVDTSGVVGLGAAATLAAAEREERAARLRALEEELLSGLRARLDGVHLNGHPTQRLPGLLNLSFDLVDAEELVEALADEVAVSSGSACSSDSVEPSHVLTAMGCPATGGVRFGLGWGTSPAEVRLALERTAAAVERLRGEP